MRGTTAHTRMSSGLKARSAGTTARSKTASYLQKGVEETRLEQEVSTKVTRAADDDRRLRRLSRLLG